MNRYIGIDLGGTNLRAAIADTDTGEIFHQRKCPTLAAEGQDAVIQRIVKLIRELTQEKDGLNGSIRGVGIGVPGTPDIDTGVIQFLPNLPGKWLDVPLRAIIEETAATLEQSPRDARLYRALNRTYFHPAPTQEKAAELLDLPFSTYRRHLSAGVARLIDALWHRELHGTEN